MNYKFILTLLFLGIIFILKYIDNFRIDVVQEQVKTSILYILGKFPYIFGGFSEKLAHVCYNVSSSFSSD